MVLKGYDMSITEHPLSIDLCKEFLVSKARFDQGQSRELKIKQNSLWIG